MFRVVLPLITGFGTSFMCPIPKNVQGNVLPQTPPKNVFPIVWTILYILIGISWQRAKDNQLVDIMHIVLTCLLILWIILYSCKNRQVSGLYTLACIHASCVSCMILHTDKLSTICLSPLLAWIIIAYSLNYNIINV